MATPSEYERKQQRNVAALQARIDRIFRKAAEEAARIGISIRDIPDDRIFSFDDYPKTLKQVERLLDALHSSVQATVTDGIRLGWSLADDKNDALVRRVFGKCADKLTPAQQRIYLARNADALEAFIARKTAGLNLSDRVWRYTNAFRSEIEMGLDIGIRSGLPASQMARELKKYLQHPDKLFRRVRDKHGMLKLSKAAAAFHPGRGVYRSSYKNARRLAATETNIAYRTADYERRQSQPMVVGIEVHLSGNHTCLGRDGKMHELTDICDDLAGKYPKNFKFTGWHPLCRCFATEILKTDKELAEDRRRILRGEEPLPSSDSVNSVKEYPPAFKEWVEKNAGRIEAAEHRGKLPYFIADNKRTVDRFLGRSPKMTPLEAAAQRHANRTAQQSGAIQQRWNDRRISMLDAAVANGLLPKECSKAIASLRSLNLAGKFDEIGGRIKTLQNAALRHQGRPQSQIDRIQDAWDAKLRRDETTRLVARNVLKAAQNWQEVDFSRLEQLVKDNRLGAMGAETRNVAQAIKAMRDKENALKDLIPDVHALHGKYTLAELADAHKSIRDTLDFWKTKYGADLATDSNLAKLKSELELKIKFVANPGAFKAGAVQKKTWQVQQDAYAKLLEKVETRIEFTTVINPKYEELLKFKTTSKDFNNYMAKVKAAIDAGDAATAKHFLSSAETRKKSLEFKRKRKAKTTSSTTFNVDKLYAGGTPFTAAEIAKIKDFEDRIVQNLLNYGLMNGSLNTEYHNYILRLSEKYYSRQLSLYGAAEQAAMKKAADTYLARASINPGYIWGTNVGGVYNGRQYQKRLSYLKRLKAIHDNGLTGDELSIVQRFTNGSTFSNAYNLRHTSPYWENKWKDKMSRLSAAQSKEMEQIIEEWSQGANYTLDRMVRYNGVTFRGLDSGGGPELRAALTKAFKNGTAWVNEASCSTSMKYSVAKSFDGDLIMVIHNKTGAYIHAVSDYSSEYEIMTLRGAKYRVIKPPTFAGGRWIAELEEI